MRLFLDAKFYLYYTRMQETFLFRAQRKFTRLLWLGTNHNDEDSEPWFSRPWDRVGGGGDMHGVAKGKGREANSLPFKIFPPENGLYRTRSHSWLFLLGGRPSVCLNFG
jgi:hypothetical protein